MNPCPICSFYNKCLSCYWRKNTLLCPIHGTVGWSVVWGMDMIKCWLTNDLGLNSRSSTNQVYNFGSLRIYTSWLMSRNNVLYTHAHCHQYQLNWYEDMKVLHQELFTWHLAIRNLWSRNSYFKLHVKLHNKLQSSVNNLLIFSKN